MSAPYTHTVTLPFTDEAHITIANFVDTRFAVIFEEADYQAVAKASWKATAKTSRVYRVALHTEEPPTIIVSQIQ